MKNILLRILTMALSICMIAAMTIFPASASENNSLTIPTMDQLGKDGSLPLGLSSINEGSEVQELTADELMLAFLSVSDMIDKDTASMGDLIGLVSPMITKVAPIITDGDFVKIISNQSYPESFRYSFMDFYRTINTTNTEEYNEALKGIVESGSESDFIRRSAAVLMNASDDKSAMLRELYYQVDESDKGAILKRLSFDEPTAANAIAKEILGDYADYTTGMVGLADSVLVHTMQGADDKALILDINKELLNSSNEEYESIALFSLADLQEPEAVALVFANADFSNRAIQTFIKDNFDLVTKYLDTATAEEVTKCITAAPIKQFTEYLAPSNGAARYSRSGVDTDALLDAIEVYNTPIKANARSGYLAYKSGVAYRDNVTIGGLGNQWHAAIIYGGNTDYRHFAQASGYPGATSGEVGFTNEAGFLGVKTPGEWTGIRTWLETTPSEETDILNMSNRLATDISISYTVFSLVSANVAGLVSGNWVEPHLITDLRCDGFVEYVYEYNALRLQGEPNLWNIATLNGYRNHNSVKYTPITQAASPYFNQITYP